MVAEFLLASLSALSITSWWIGGELPRVKATPRAGPTAKSWVTGGAALESEKNQRMRMQSAAALALRLASAVVRPVARATPMRRCFLVSGLPKSLISVSGLARAS